jgi:hypothetical protein
MATDDLTGLTSPAKLIARFIGNPDTASRTSYRSEAVV